MSLEKLTAALEQEQRRNDERTLGDVAQAVRCGIGTLQSADRRADIHRRRSVAAWILVYFQGWTVAKTAKSLHRTERQLLRLLNTQREPSKKRRVVSC